jgi:hypothetical protein
MAGANGALTRRRILLIMTVVVLVAGSVAVGWLAATWPSWRAAIY